MSVWGGKGAVRGVVGLLAAAAGSIALGSAAVQVSTVLTPPGATNVPGGIAVDADGNLYSADFGGTVVFRVTPDGEVSTFATGLLTPSGNAFDSRGRYYQSNYQDPANPSAIDAITRVNTNGKASTFATGLVGPVGIAMAPDDTLFVAMCNVNQVWRIDQSGASSVFAATFSFSCPNGIAFDDVGDLYVVSFNNGIVVRIRPDGTTTDVATIPGGGNGHIVYIAGSLFITDRVGHRVYEVVMPKREGGRFKTKVFAGTGVVGAVDGPGLNSTLASPNGIARNAAGDRIYVNQGGGAIREMTLELPRPAKPNKVKAGDITSTSVEISWNDRDRREESFVLQRAVGRKGPFETIQTLPWNTTTAVIEGLESGTKYQFRVIAANGTNASAPSRKVRVTTK